MTVTLGDYTSARLNEFMQKATLWENGTKQAKSKTVLDLKVFKNRFESFVTSHTNYIKFSDSDKVDIIKNKLRLAKQQFLSPQVRNVVIWLAPDRRSGWNYSSLGSKLGEITTLLALTGLAAYERTQLLRAQRKMQEAYNRMAPPPPAYYNPSLASNVAVANPYQTTAAQTAPPLYPSLGQPVSAPYGRDRQQPVPPAPAPAPSRRGPGQPAIQPQYNSQLGSNIHPSVRRK